MLFFSKYKRDIFIITGLLLAAAAALFVMRGAAPRRPVALVSVNSQVVERIELTGDERLISLEQYGVDVVLKTGGGGICFEHSSCPDKICVNTGVISRPGQAAVCLPNKTIVTIEEEG